MKRSIKIAATTAAAVSSAMLVKKAKENKVEEKENTYRNTELGKHDKNSKGIYYTNGNYEAFARPKKPEGVENKSAYLIGSGLASLAAACFLVRDGQMPGKNIHILEAMDIAGGLVMVSLIQQQVILCVVEEKWKTTLNVYGIYLEVFLL